MQYNYPMRWLLKRWWFWAWTAFMLVAVCVGYLLIPFNRDRITKANYDKIQKRWSIGQVEELLGKATFRTEGSPNMHIRTPNGWIHGTHHLIWKSEDGDLIDVIFGSGGVKEKRFEPGMLSSLSPWDRMKLQVDDRIQALWP